MENHVQDLGRFGQAEPLGAGNSSFENNARTPYRNMDRTYAGTAQHCIPATHSVFDCIPIDQRERASAIYTKILAELESAFGNNYTGLAYLAIWEKALRNSKINRVQLQEDEVALAFLSDILEQCVSSKLVNRISPVIEVVLLSLGRNVSPLTLKEFVWPTIKKVFVDLNSLSVPLKEARLPADTTRADEHTRCRISSYAALRLATMQRHVRLR